MIFIITHTHAHRLLNAGIIQSAPIHEDGKGAGKVYFVNESEFAQIDQSQMNLTGGDFEEVRQDLKRLNQICEKFYRLPSTEVEVKTPRSGSDPV